MSETAKDLIERVRSGDAEKVRDGLASGCEATTTDKWGNSALMYAAANGNVDICQLLLDAGADPHHKNQWGMDARAWSRWTEEQPGVIALLR
ncbi:MAG: ankyrin repeat domain-containing protein [Rhodospirillales bacterium]